MGTKHMGVLVKFEGRFSPCKPLILIIFTGEFFQKIPSGTGEVTKEHVPPKSPGKNPSHKSCIFYYSINDGF